MSSLASTAPAVSAKDSAQTAESKLFLSGLLGKTLLIHTTDGRLFSGEFKCTDNECNIILGTAYEYRYPDEQAAAAVAEDLRQNGEKAGASRLDMKSRFMGLVVVPGMYIVNIEVQ